MTHAPVSTARCLFEDDAESFTVITTLRVTSFRITLSRIIGSKVLAATICLVVALGVSHADAGIINVAFGNRGPYGMNGVASNDSAESATSGTAAPLVYSGTTWNEPIVNDTRLIQASNLLTSTGVSTNVGLTLTDYADSVNDHGGIGILRLLGAGVHADGPKTTGGFNPNPGTLPALTLTGLNDLLTYTLVIISGGNYSNVNEWNIGGTPHFGDAQTPTGFQGMGITLTTFSDINQRGTWVEGVNYVVFTGQRSVGGVIKVWDRNIDLVPPITHHEKFSINGFQLQGVIAVPEPGTWVLGLCGLTAVVGGALRNRRRA